MDIKEAPLGAYFSDLYSEQSSKRLAQISALRSRGIGEHIALPQLVVCGDQSTGKSSVLERITGIPFPRQDGLCTRFPAEITLEHTNAEPEILATIIPRASRDQETKRRLEAYGRVLVSFAELPSVIDEVGQLMGLRGYSGIASGPSFGKDVLRIKATGQTNLNISIVDLPGLIENPNEEQTENDVDIVHALVDEYAQNPRSIMLAVVQAGNDIANQKIIKKSKTFDRSGMRTVGVITKPDLINEGAQARIAALSRNEDSTKLTLGFFLVKNPLKSVALSMEATDEEESAYFSSPPWRDQDLDAMRTGVQALRRFLHNLLDRHTEHELPKVREDVRKVLRETRKTIEGLGPARPTPSHVRVYLSRLAMEFNELTNAALRGDYHGRDIGFFSAGSSHRRLRAYVHEINTAFSNDMRLCGAALKVKADSWPDMDTEEDDVDEVSADCINYQPVDGPQMSVSDTEFKCWIKTVSSARCTRRKA